MIALARIVVRLLADLAGLVVLALRRRRSVEAEDLFLRRQLALYQDRGIKARRVDSATLIRWHRAGWRLFWRVKSRLGRPPIPLELRRLIRRMATENPLWGEERIANELLPSAAWTLQQLREVVGFDRAHRHLIHDRDSIFARSLDESIGNLGLTVLKSPPHSPKANTICERVIGTLRRECLDWLIPLSESHRRSILTEWAGHDNHARPHMALGPGVPDPPSEVASSAIPLTRHRIGEHLRVRARSVPGGLHHEYLLTPAWA